MAKLAHDARPTNDMRPADALADLPDMSQDAFNLLSPAWLAQMQDMIQAHKARAKALDDRMTALLRGRYSARLAAERTPGVEHGTVHLTEGGMDIAGERTKEVTWDQDGLEELRAKIEASGEDPARFITTEVKHKVSEVDFAKWDDATREPFLKYRTVTAKPEKITVSVPTAEKKKGKSK